MFTLDLYINRKLKSLSFDEKFFSNKIEYFDLGIKKIDNELLHAHDDNPGSLLSPLTWYSWYLHINNIELLEDQIYDLKRPQRICRSQYARIRALILFYQNIKNGKCRIFEETSRRPCLIMTKEGYLYTWFSEDGLFSENRETRYTIGNIFAGNDRIYIHGCEVKENQLTLLDKNVVDVQESNDSKEDYIKVIKNKDFKKG